MVLDVDKIISDAKSRMIYSTEMTKNGMSIALSGEVAEMQELSDALVMDSYSRRLGIAAGRISNFVKKEERKRQPKSDVKLNFNDLIGSEIVDIFWYGGLIVDNRGIDIETVWDNKCKANDEKYGRTGVNFST